MKKDNIRSFRFSDRVLKILEGFEGKSLNDKFENLVLYCHDEVPKTEARLKHLNECIASKYKEFDKLRKDAYYLDHIQSDFQTLRSNFDHLTWAVHQLMDRLDDRVEGDVTQD